MAFLSATASAETFETGRTAYMQGEYARAFEILKPLARKGDPKAAYIVGRQYQLGQGVGRDLGEAWYWYRRAEAKGHVEAGLFRHLLVSKWKMSEADRARGEAKFAALARRERRALARVQLRPSPRPTPAVAMPANLPRSVTVSKLPKAAARPTPQPVARRAPAAANPPEKTLPKGQDSDREPNLASRPQTCTWCRNDNDFEPDDDRRPERAVAPYTHRQERAERPLEQDAMPSWREEQYYAPGPIPPAAVFPGRRYRGAWRRPVWRRPGWRTRMRWGRFPPGLARRWRSRGWRRF